MSGMAARIIGGVRAGADALRAALELMSHAQPNDGQALRWMWLGLAIVQGSLAGELWTTRFSANWPPSWFGRLVTPLHWLYSRRRSPTGRGPLLAGEFATAATLIEEAA